MENEGRKGGSEGEGMRRNEKMKEGKGKKMWRKRKWGKMGREREVRKIRREKWENGGGKGKSKLGENGIEKIGGGEAHRNFENENRKI